MQRHIQNPVKHLSWGVLLKELRALFRTFEVECFEKIANDFKMKQCAKTVHESFRTPPPTETSIFKIPSTVITGSILDNYPIK